MQSSRDRAGLCCTLVSRVAFRPIVPYPCSLAAEPSREVRSSQPFPDHFRACVKRKQRLGWWAASGRQKDSIGRACRVGAGRRHRLRRCCAALALLSGTRHAIAPIDVSCQVSFQKFHATYFPHPGCIACCYRPEPAECWGVHRVAQLLQQLAHMPGVIFLSAFLFDDLAHQRTGPNPCFQIVSRRPAI